MSFGPREKVPRVALRLQKPKGVSAPKGWEGAVSVWRLREVQRNLARRLIVLRAVRLSAYLLASSIACQSMSTFAFRER